MRRRGPKSFVDDLVLSRGVVLSRAELFCDLLRLSPMTRRFVRFRRTYLSETLLLPIDRVAGSVPPTASVGFNFFRLFAQTLLRFFTFRPRLREHFSREPKDAFYILRVTNEPALRTLATSWREFEGRV